MRLTRRNTVIGLGTLAVGAGAIGGSGAFDSVEADRSFDVGVQGDADALLGLTVLNENIADYQEGGSGDNDTIHFRLEDGSLNDDATTEFFRAFEVANNGSQDVELRIETDDGGGNPVDGLYFRESEEAHDLTEPFRIDQGDAIDVDIVINTRDTADGGYENPNGDPYQITIIAESVDQ